MKRLRLQVSELQYFARGCLAGSVQDANSINQKEVMLDRKVTDYSCIMNSAYNFEPFCKVWQVVAAPVMRGCQCVG